MSVCFETSDDARIVRCIERDRQLMTEGGVV